MTTHTLTPAAIDRIHRAFNRRVPTGAEILVNHARARARKASYVLNALAAGRHKYRTALRQLADCRRTNRYLGPADPPTWRIPDHAMPRVELTASGQPINL
ncbi:MAG: hypothetical protein AB7U20_20410 [Planctomycetaceae bacterium]